jgi:hypothetical protein
MEKPGMQVIIIHPGVAQTAMGMKPIQQGQTSEAMPHGTTVLLISRTTSEYVALIKDVCS